MLCGVGSLEDKGLMHLLSAQALLIQDKDISDVTESKLVPQASLVKEFRSTTCSSQMLNHLYVFSSL